MCKVHLSLALFCLLVTAAVRGDDVPPPAGVQSFAAEANRLAEMLRSGETSAETVHRQRRLAAELKRLLGQENSPPPTAGESAPNLIRSDREASLTSQNALSPTPLRTDLTGEESTATIEIPPAQPLIQSDAIWGHLPQHEREELQRTFTEKFLPKYDSALKNYFRRLAEQSPRD